jgi:putative ABC transport system substrate-binding protein
MRRREFLGVLGGATVAWPLAAGAQQPALPVIGFLNAGSAAGREHLVAAFRQGLKEAGFVEGQNVATEYLWAEGQHDRLPALANDFIQRHVSIIIATGGPTSILGTNLLAGNDQVRTSRSSEICLGKNSIH